jgi:hypothetical protein
MSKKIGLALNWFFSAILLISLTKAGRVKIAEDIKKSGMIASAIKQIVNTDRAWRWY